MWRQKYLVGVGDYIGKANNQDNEKMNKPLTNVEKDRVKVLLLSFLIVIVFWGAFEQAGGLMNIYAFDHFLVSAFFSHIILQNVC